jgi:hypothetical protein
MTRSCSANHWTIYSSIGHFGCNIFHLKCKLKTNYQCTETIGAFPSNINNTNTFYYICLEKPDSDTQLKKGFAAISSSPVGE